MAEAALALSSPEEIEYPESDGEPMAETDDHRDELSEIVQTLKRQFEEDDDVYVSGNLLLYYEEGDPEKCRAPDVFVVQGVAKKQRRTYKLWEEGKAPTMAIELTSKKTKTEDLKTKPALYGRLGVRYLFLYDVLGDYLKPSLQGMRLTKDGRSSPIAGPPKGPLPCPPLRLDLLLDEAGRLQFRDRETGEMVVRLRPALDQEVAARRQAEERAEAEAEARRQAEEALATEARARRKAEAKIEELLAQFQKREEEDA